MSDVPMLVAAPTELVAIPAMRRGAARPAVVTVSTPPAIVRLPPTTLALVPSERVILHLQEDDKSGDQKHFMIMRTLTIWG